ncbi:MAG: C45 family peptidase [Planctomycetota bacterium]|nr:C45 family peptidase [Planctomycetota bacterium]
MNRVLRPAIAIAAFALGAALFIVEPGTRAARNARLLPQSDLLTCHRVSNQEVARLRQTPIPNMPPLKKPAAAAAQRLSEHGKLETIAGIKVLTLEGTPAEMGTAAGRLLGPIIRRVVAAIITNGVAQEEEARRNLYRGSAIMEKYQPEAYREELRAMAQASEVVYEDLLLLQYFGDVRRCLAGAGASAFCTSFAVLPPLTRGNICLMGRNFDYFDQGVGEYASLIVYYQPAGKIPFLTLTWAGVINGWTLLNAKGIAVSNNTAIGAEAQSLEGISTCFLLRQIAENASSVEQGIEIARRGPRACGTNLLIVSGNPPDAAIVEFDHRQFAVRRPENGFVGAANDFLLLGRTAPLGYTGRIGKAYEIALANRGRIDLFTTLADAEGVPIESMNLHCSQIDATNLRLRVAMGRIPAYRLLFQVLCLTPEGVKADRN